MRTLIVTIIFVLIFIDYNNAQKTAFQSEMRRLSE